MDLKYFAWKKSEASKKLAHDIMAHANAHWGEDGWDMVVECMSIDEIVDEIVLNGIKSVDEFYALCVSPWNDKRLDIIAGSVSF